MSIDWQWVVGLVALTVMPAAAQDAGPAQEWSVPVEGDAQLLEVVKAAQAANLDRFAGPGRVQAQIRWYAGGKTVPAQIMDVDCRWLGEKYLADLVYRFPPAGRLPPEDPAQREQWEREIASGEETDPNVRRLVFDGKEYLQYDVHGGTGAGRVVVYAKDAKGLRSYLWFLEMIDQTPAGQWSLSHGRGTRAWAELLGPHPKMKAEWTEKFVVRRDGDRVVIERHNPESFGGGVKTSVADLALSGHVVESSFSSPNQQGRTDYEWVRGDDGRVVLHGVRAGGTDKGGEWRFELDIDYQGGVAGIDDGLFTLAGMRVRSGAIVERDGKRTTYQAAEVTQDVLEGLIQESKSDGN